MFTLTMQREHLFQNSWILQISPCPYPRMRQPSNGKNAAHAEGGRGRTLFSNYRLGSIGLKMKSPPSL